MEHQDTPSPGDLEQIDQLLRDAGFWHFEKGLPGQPDRHIPLVERVRALAAARRELASENGRLRQEPHDWEARLMLLQGKALNDFCDMKRQLGWVIDRREQECSVLRAKLEDLTRQIPDPEHPEVAAAMRLVERGTSYDYDEKGYLTDKGRKALSADYACIRRHRIVDWELDDDTCGRLIMEHLRRLHATCLRLHQTNPASADFLDLARRLLPHTARSTGSENPQT